MGKKQKLTKSFEQRCEIVDGIMKRFVDLGVTPEMLPSKFLEDVNEYKTEDCPCGFSGKVFVPELKRYIEYILPLSFHAVEVVRLTQ
jgi:hypothetical protein